MKNYRKIFLAVFFAIYAIGVFSGSFSQVKQGNQQEMYTYLEGAVSSYDAKLYESIIATCRDNLILFVLCAVGVIFKFAVPGIAVAILMRGYSAGFAITAAMRLYGWFGVLLCAANIISLALLIPALSACGCGAIGNIAENRFDKKRFLKRAAFFVFFLIAAFAADSILRGGLSAVFTDFAAGFLTKN